MITTDKAKNSALDAAVKAEKPFITGGVSLDVATGYTIEVKGFDLRDTKALNDDGKPYCLTLAYGIIKDADGEIKDSGFTGLLVDNIEFFKQMKVNETYVFDITERDAKNKKGEAVKRKSSVNWRL